MRQGYHSEYTGIPAYLMDFGFGGFLGYGKGMPVGLVVNEELKCENEWALENQETVACLHW